MKTNNSIATMKNLQLLSQVVYSNSMAVVEQHNFFFENLWDKSISATEKIDEIEKGIVPEIVDVIKNPFEIKSIYFDVLKSSTHRNNAYSYNFYCFYERGKRGNNAIFDRCFK